ncbi:MAG TPA: AAA family ATPase [Vicinamibacterales bacterium]|nr:AAA family ATPase [Vicinamibacterales bacterium]
MRPRGTFRRQIDVKVATVTDRLIRHVVDEERLAVVQAPPGSGKTHLLLRAAKEAYRARQRVSVATQTRSQADDICRRFSEAGVPAIRFVAHGDTGAEQPPGIDAIARHQDLPHGPCIAVGTTAKWGLIELADPFDVLFVEEAWQMAWADFMLLGQVAGRFVLIGDPGQIAPVVSIDASRWETAPRAPHRPAPELVLSEHRKSALDLSLPATRRLPACTAGLIRPFYDFPFDAWAEPGERLLVPLRRVAGVRGAVIERLGRSSVVGVTLPTPEGGPPLECDSEVAATAVGIARGILESQPDWVMGQARRRLRPPDIGLCATHHVMNAEMALHLDRRLDGINIDTPERWQGLQRKVMIIVHPLSGVVQPSAFDLETGRLCVMASRHEIALVVVTRNHLPETLDSHMPAAEQAVGRPDVSGRGHHQNTVFWGALVERDQVVEARGPESVG